MFTVPETWAFLLCPKSNTLQDPSGTLDFALNVMLDIHEGKLLNLGTTFHDFRVNAMV